MTQAQLAGKNLSRAFISQIETGRFEPSLATLEILAQRLGKPVAYFLGGLDESSENRYSNLQHVMSTLHSLEERLNSSTASTIRQELHRIQGEYPALPESLEGHIVRLVALTHVYSEEYDAAIERLGEASRVFQDRRDDYGLAKTYNALGSAYLLRGEAGTAVHYFQLALDLVDRVQPIDTQLKIRLLYNAGTAYLKLKNYVAALQVLLEALALSVAISYFEVFGDIRMMLGVTYRYLGDLDKAEKEYQKALLFYIAIENDDRVARSHVNLGILSSHKGRYENALAHFRRAAKLFQRLGKSHNLGNVYGEMGRVYFMLSRFDEASSYLQSAINLMVSDDQEKARIRLFLARSLAQLAKASEAIKNLELALQTAEVMHDESLIVDVHSELGRLLMSLGQHEAAARHLAAALDLAKRAQ